MRKILVLVSVCALLAVVSVQAGERSNMSFRSEEPTPRGVPFTVIEYDGFEDEDGYTLADYQAKWFNPFGLGELDPAFHGDTRQFVDGKMSISAVPFLTSFDFSVFDHIKYIAVGVQPFDVPVEGWITFSADIEASTPGVIPGRVIEGVYVESGQPYREVVLDGQQAAATLHMIDFATGQLFDWFVTSDKAFALSERLPSLVTGSPIPAGIDKIYTQIIKEVEISPGPHNYAIRYARKADHDEVTFLIDGHVAVKKTMNIGVPLDKQGLNIINWPSLGDGEPLKDQIGQFVMAHGLFSLLDEFPFQHPEAPEYNVSIPVENRIFGQGAAATFDNFKVVIKEDLD